MRLIEVSEPSDSLYLVPLGDMHFGDSALGKKGLNKLRGYVKWILDHPNAYTFLMGDIFTMASRTSKTGPLESLTAAKAWDMALAELGPLAAAGRIVGAVPGNHENRMRDSFGICPVELLAQQLGFPYLGFSGVVKFRVGRRAGTDNQYWQIYHGYFHHGTGGGGSLGGALNRKVKLGDIVQGVDFYASGHDHQLAVGTKVVFVPTASGLEERKLTYIDTGSFLDYSDSYVEQGMYSPSKLGAPRIRLSGERNKHDLHVSI